MKANARILALAAFVIALASCRATTAVSNAVPAVGAAIDCALPSLWSAFTPEDVIAAVKSGVAQVDPLAALALLAESYGEAEVTCVAAHLQASQTIAAAKAEAVPSPLAAWLANEKAKGLLVRNFATLPAPQ